LEVGETDWRPARAAAHRNTAKIWQLGRDLAIHYNAFKRGDVER